ncbi:GGDEF/EAL domain protein [Glaciecola sp. KUL10]|nr:GGDEF/EAL domain protein [Glaciecola sp. KUL10]
MGTMTYTPDLFNSSQQDTVARLRLLYGNALGGLVVTFACMSLLCFGFDNAENQFHKTLIWSLLFVSHSLRLADNFFSQKRLADNKVDTAPIITRFAVGIVANSCIWASYSIFVMPSASLMEITLSAIILSALAGGTITIMAASTVLSVFYMSALLLPYSIVILIEQMQDLYYIAWLGIVFWFVMLASAFQAGKSISTTFVLKNQNENLLSLMALEKKEIERINQKLSEANIELDNHAAHLESEVLRRTEEIYNLSNIDPLTNLMNRSAFTKNLKERLKTSTTKHENFALLFIDLDGFKDINDGFGHKIGDSVLSEISLRLEEVVTKCNADALQKCQLCRWGGDEFLVLTPFASVKALNDLVENIQERIKAKINIASNQLNVGASIGISLYPEHGQTSGELIQFADISMYHHKHLRSGNAIYFTPSLYSEFQHDQFIRDGLKNALKNNEFRLNYHPIIDIQSNKVWAVEALIRWKHKDINITPDEFISIAERSGRIIEIGAWVIKQACLDAAKWEFSEDTAVSINVSSLQLLDSKFISLIDSALSESGLAANRLHLEITESVMLENGELASAQLNALADRGIHISIDDFGTGYSSLNQLQTMFFDVIKIDRSFLQTLDKRDLTIIAATKLIADEFNASTVAEGIETLEELDVLKSLDIRYIQGYFFSKPLNSADLVKWIRAFNT